MGESESEISSGRYFVPLVSVVLLTVVAIALSPPFILLEMQLLWKLSNWLTAEDQPWPIIEDEKLLIETCRAWCKATLEATDQNMDLPQIPTSVAALSAPRKNFADTHIDNGQVWIYIGYREDKAFMDWNDITPKYYIVIPEGAKSPILDSKWNGGTLEATENPNIFKFWITYSI